MESLLNNLGQKFDGPIAFPFLKTIYDFYSPRARQITAWSIGFSFGGFEANALEMVGCEITVFDPRPDAKDRFSIFRRISETHETEEADPKWAEALLDHWFSVKKVQLKDTLPFFTTGTLTMGGQILSTTELDTDTVPRIDLLKIHMPDFECPILYAMLHAGYRPGLLWVHWSAHPDSDLQTSSAAGHLQNLGYTLLKADELCFLYYYNDNSLYDICSWAVEGIPNPMVDTILRSKIGETSR
jgi:hypothetical protein